MPTADIVEPEPWPRLTPLVLISMCLLLAALVSFNRDPKALYTVVLLKLHLVTAGGYVGYWIDRALFPYDRPHTYLEPDEWAAERPPGDGPDGFATLTALPATFGQAMLRRAIVVGACVLAMCIGL